MMRKKVDADENIEKDKGREPHRTINFCSRDQVLLDHVCNTFLGLGVEVAHVNKCNVLFFSLFFSSFLILEIELKAFILSNMPSL